jgi:hypothetical protein
MEAGLSVIAFSALISSTVSETIALEDGRCAIRGSGTKTELILSENTAFHLFLNTES